MGSLRTLAVAGAAVFGVSATAMAADMLPPPPMIDPPQLKGVSIGSGWYLRGDVGVGHQTVGKYTQADVQQYNGRFYNKVDSQAVFVGAGVGYKINNWFRFDVTGEYRGASHIGVSDTLFNPFARGPQTNTYRGNISSFVGLFNAYIDLGTWNCLTPYIGGGVGFAHNSITGLQDNGIVFSNFPTGPVSPTQAYAGTGTKTGLAWALMAGLGYEVNKNLTLEAGYRYLNLGDAQSGRLIDAFTVGQTYAPLKAKDIESHDFKIGMRWMFGDPDCCATPAPAPAPYHPPMVRKF